MLEKRQEGRCRKKTEVTIYTDGACPGKSGPGGWGAVLLFENQSKEISGGEIETTSNRMEMMAAIRALESLKFSCTVKLYTDSTYLQKGMTAWLAEWKKNNWIRQNKREVRNQDLWQKLDQLNSERDIEWLWVAGHSGDKWNDRADNLARAAVPNRNSKN